MKAAWDYSDAKVRGYTLYRLRTPRVTDDYDYIDVPDGSLGKWLLKEDEFGLITVDGEVGRELFDLSCDLEDLAIYHESKSAAEEALMLRLLKLSS